ncbi:Non-repetitive/WGA-negative nucleoporin C-terminal-domain-containing protein [Paraphoma chrysanthemicola]|uniref:Non-repetitive/WGA-negative nucleoporin C-terminal-domain-containing protein n=1 Tax=Paraphoma chrysanthemicola TaxID=798071 RepID=A0A8K0W4A3_9PLEO|nr:Non-repetitive/WGA-negative nucleoporin C-terminal-domain-containing protein [Paraphoma chrysanthemicola]
MFSPEASIQSARSSLRNTRRRQRTSEGLSQQPRRKRSKLNDESFVAKDDVHVNGNGSALMNGHAGHSSVENSLVVVDMPVREKKAPQKRAPKEDNSLYLTRNANFNLKKLPGFPTALLRPSTPFRATALSSAGLALALTYDRAFVWEYHAEIAPKSVALPLPFGLRAADPLPLGAVVQNGPTNDFGVLAVAPSTGKIAFWENIDSAEARNLYPQRHQAVEGSLKLYSGETITDVTDIQHAGFVLTTSSGRLAHLTLRDSQGRPSITATILSAPSTSNGSFFSLKGLLGGAIRKTVASVKARSSESKGQMEVITATRAGLFTQWDLSWSGQHNFIREVDVQSNIASAIQPDASPESRSLRDVQILDFVIMEQQHAAEVVRLLVLVAASSPESLDYSLLEVDLSSTGGLISRAIPIRTFHQLQLPKEPTGTLLVPYPGHTAYVLFTGAICVTSLAQPEESPNNQLLLDAGRSTLPFQDTIYFREDMDVVVSGHALEQENRKNLRATALLFIQQFGLVQISAEPPTDDLKDDDRTKITARSKLEQATFFSTTPGNLLDFSVKSRFSFPDEEIAQAAIDISSGILSSSYDHLDKVISNLDDHFQKRAAALRTLIAQLLSDYPPISFQTKWRLLAQAEKLEASHKLWLWYQEKQHDQQIHPELYPDNILMGDIVKALNERYKTPIQTDLGENDTIRQFFLKDVDSLHVLIPWGWFFLRTFYIKDGTKEQPPVMQRLSEGNDVMLVTLEAAFEFRQANIEAYDLDPETLDDGILKPGHGNDVLPHFWTSGHNVVSSVRSLVDVGRNLAVSNYEEGYQEGLSQKIGKDNPRLVKLGCQTHIERFQWALEQSDEKTREMGRSLRTEWNVNVRPNHIFGLTEIGLATEGMKLAEQYHDMPTLVNLVWDETNWLESEKATTRSKMEQAESTVKLNRIKERISRYFEVYSDAWAEAFYSKYIKENQAAQLFIKEYLNQPALTKFLRAEPSRSRLRWINEVLGEKNYEAAGAALHDAATKQETNAWCQRVELSMAKLAMLCKDQVRSDAAPLPPTTDPKQKTKSERVRDSRFSNTVHQLEYAKIQEQVYERLLPIISQALDKESAVELLMAEFGQGRLRERPAHQSILKEGFENLIHHRVIDPSLMIDILTLMDSDDKEEVNSLLQSNEYVYAIRVLMINWDDMNRTTRESLLKLIWKRLCIRDNWAEINQTRDISDAKLNDFLQHTNIGWVWRGVLKLMEKDSLAKQMIPRKLDELLGAGGTHGELCVRFSSEDLREPIIKDNLLDDDILREHFEKHRFPEWFKAAVTAGKIAYFAEKRQQLQAVQQQPLADEQTRANTQTESGAAGAAGTGGEELEVVEVAGSDTFEGDTESVADQDADVEMQDS